jgi:hypothetical protein
MYRRKMVISKLLYFKPIPQSAPQNYSSKRLPLFFETAIRNFRTKLLLKIIPISQDNSQNYFTKPNAAFQKSSPKQYVRVKQASAIYAAKSGYNKRAIS